MDLSQDILLDDLRNLLVALVSNIYSLAGFVKSDSFLVEQSADLRMLSKVNREQCGFDFVERCFGLTKMFERSWLVWNMFD